MSEQPQRSDIPHLQDWANAMAFVASHYRQSYSPGTLHAAAEWATQKTLPDALKHLCRHAGLHCQFLNGNDRKMSAWRLPLVVQLKDGQIGII
ncbi:TPA: type I secretion system permease/ATPase, partial [Klebsiella pneumoniae]|nr:type I secretion system permease/ATPase [Klebsiella pneumoniae]